MSPHPLAGEPAPREMLVDVPRLVASYYTLHPDPAVAGQRVAFGTSGHRGSSLDAGFNEDHILAVAQALAEYRARQGVDGPLVLGADTHALSEPALRTALEVLVANGVEVVVAQDFAAVPTPVVSHAVLAHNGRPGTPRADGVVITPSHNPPRDGGFKYNPPHGGPAGTEATGWIQQRANALLEGGLAGVRRIRFERAAAEAHVRDLVTPYVEDVGNAVDLEAVKAAGVRIGVDPLGGSSLHYWEPIAERWGLDLTVVNTVVDPTFAFMRVDHDGKIRMDCSSPQAMAGLIGLKDDFDVAFGNDPDADRHGIVTPSAGLLNPNHYLSVAVDYLFRHRPGLAGRRGGGQDPGVELDDRSRRGRSRPSPGRGAGRLQVFRRRLAPWALRLRGRGERRRILPPARRRRLDDRQGRAAAGAPGRGDHGRHRQGSRRALRRADGALRRPGCMPAATPLPTRRRNGCWPGCRPTR